MLVTQCSVHHILITAWCLKVCGDGGRCFGWAIGTTIVNLRLCIDMGGGTCVHGVMGYCGR